MRVLLSLLLALGLALTAQKAVEMRGQMMAVGQMVICRGATVVVIHVDGTGAPVEAPHLCPDYALSLLTAIGTGPDLPVHMVTATALGYDQTALVAGTRPGQSAQARAPPIAV